MAQNSWPFENADTTEDQYSLLFGRYGKPGTMFMGVASQPNQTSAGSLTVYGDSSGMQVKVRSGFAVVRGFAYQNTTNGQTVAIDTASSNPRIDLIVLRLDPSANTIVLAVVKGTPATTPTAPALTQNDTTGIYEMEIGRVTVPALASVIAAGNVSDTRPCLPVGVGVWTTTQRPTGVQGQMGWNTTTSQLEVYTGSAWQEVKPSAIDASTISSGTLSISRIADGSIGTDKLFTNVGTGVLLGVDAGPGIKGIPFYHVDYSGMVNNPTVGTTYTTTGPSVTTGGTNDQIIVTGTAFIGSAAADRTIFIKITQGSTVIKEFSQWVGSGQTATVSMTVPHSAGYSATTYKMNYKSSSSTTTSIDGYLTVQGYY